MKKLLNKIAGMFKNKNRNNIHDVCRYASGELGSYCENERIYIR